MKKKIQPARWATAPPRPDLLLNRSQRAALQRVRKQIDADLSCHHSITSLSRIGLMNASDLKILFRRHFGTNLYRYLLTRRMELARSLLSTSGRNISEIGRSCGYANPEYFSRRFKMENGMTPSAYRHRYGGL